MWAHISSLGFQSILTLSKPNLVKYYKYKIIAITILITLRQSYYNSFTYQEHIQLTITFLIILIITTKKMETQWGPASIFSNVFPDDFFFYLETRFVEKLLWLLNNQVKNPTLSYHCEGHNVLFQIYSRVKYSFGCWSLYYGYEFDY